MKPFYVIETDLFRRSGVSCYPGASSSDQRFIFSKWHDVEFGHPRRSSSARPVRQGVCKNIPGSGFADHHINLDAC